MSASQEPALYGGRARIVLLALRVNDLILKQSNSTQKCIARLAMTPFLTSRVVAGLQSGRMEKEEAVIIE